MNHSVDAVAHGRGIDFAVRDVHVAAARNRGDILDAERYIGAVCHEANLVGFVHEVHEILRGTAHARVVREACLEVEVLERLGTHLRALRHGGVRPAEYAPARLVHAVVERFLSHLAIHEHFLVAHVAVFHEVVGPADGDVGLHFLHLGEGKFGLDLHLGFTCRKEHLATHAALGIAHEGVSAHLLDSLDELGRNFVGCVGGFDKDVLARLEGKCIVNQVFGKFRNTRISHFKFSNLFRE